MTDSQELVGDVDFDGELTIADATAIQKYLARMQGLYPIETVYAGHSSFGMTFHEFKIDFENQKFFGFYAQGNKFGEPAPPWDIFRTRDPEAENEGFDYICNLDFVDIDEFMLAAKNYGFVEWDERYVDEMIFDGHQWYVKIKFLDGKEKVIYGSNAYPETWEDMSSAFKALVGEYIF